MRRYGWATATVEDELSQQVAGAALRAEAHLGGIVLSLQTEASLPRVDPCGLGHVGDRRHLVQAAHLGEELTGELEAGLLTEGGYRVRARLAVEPTRS